MNIVSEITSTHSGASHTQTLDLRVDARKYTIAEIRVYAMPNTQAKIPTVTDRCAVHLPLQVLFLQQ